MGVAGLLGLLKSIQRPCSLKEFKGKTIGVDAYGWLHRGSIACAAKIALGQPTTQFVEFAMHRVRMLVHFGITPYLVFDGDRLPSKAGTERTRAARRAASLQLGQQLLAAGKSTEAYQNLKKAVDITPQLARQLIDELKRNNIPYVVAPYEADAQLAYLENTGIIHAVISEDSDLLVFGVKTLLTKLDQYGQCIMVRQDDFSGCREVNMAGWTLDEFRRMAILSGCDYLDSLPKMGLKTAHGIVRKYRSIHGIIRGINLENKMHVPRHYEAAFIRAEMTFRYQLVFCPEQQQLVYLNTPQDLAEVAGLDCIGAQVPAETCKKVARGDLDPITKLSLFSTPSKTIHQKPLLPPLASESCKRTPSIKSYFTGKRTPLRELDPNSFTPSPTQSRLLAANENRLWNSAPARTSIAGFAQPSHGSSSPVQLSPRQTETMQVVKRKRLCQDLDDPGEIVQPQKSKFFNTSSPVKSHRRSRTARRDFDIHSDQPLIEEPETSTEPKPADMKSAEPADDPSCSPLEYGQDPFQSTVRSKSVTSNANLIVQHTILETHVSQTSLAPSTKGSGTSRHLRREESTSISSEPTTTMPQRGNMPGAQVPIRDDDELSEADPMCATLKVRAFASYEPLKSVGSEDLLIPDSEGECDEQIMSLQDHINKDRMMIGSRRAATTAATKSIKLSRFRYSGS